MKNDQGVWSLTYGPAGPPITMHYLFNIDGVTETSRETVAMLRRHDIPFRFGPRRFPRVSRAEGEF